MPTALEIMATCTVRVLALRAGNEVSIGTGFLYAFTLKPGDAATNPDTQIFPVVVTNKHVVEGCDAVRLQFRTGARGVAWDTHGPRVNRQFIAEIGLQGSCLLHPSAEIDLCAIPVGPAMQDLEANGLQMQHGMMHSAFRADDGLRAILRSVEPIAMVGYPSGIWDSVNNAAIVRRGATATHPLVRYEGRTEFLIDAACFPGSSGSPVFLFEDGFYRTSNEGLTPGTRVVLLGVLYAGPQFTAEGTLEARPIPHSATHVPITSVPMNLGYVIQADQLDGLQEEIFRLAASASPQS